MKLTSKVQKFNWRTISVIYFLSTVLLSNSYGQTSGPTSPEASSYEPFDATDLVNMITGDFQYSVPLLTLPGPSGEFPLALSYHAGIKPNVEASWVGLGWSLNPGAINRSVNGYPDDFNAIKLKTREYWIGGESTVKSYGLSVGIGGGVSVTAGLVVAEDTYKSRSVSAYAGLGYGVALGPFSVGGSLSAPIGGGSTASGGLYAGLSTGQNLSLNLGASISPSSTGNKTTASIGLSLRGYSLVGASISSGSKSNQFSFSVAGSSSSINNSKAGKISKRESEESFSIPIWKNISITWGNQYVRYWIDETDEANVYGSLYASTNASLDLDDNDFDVYSLYTNKEIGYENLGPSPEYELGGTFTDYDNYIVSGQGVGGLIKPYAYQSYLTKRNGIEINADNEEETLIEQVPLGINSNSISFRFINDFSNSLKQDLGTFEVGPQDTPLLYSFNSIEETDGFQSNRLAGSSNIEYYTNSDIVSGRATLDNFINTKASGFTRINDDKIGGFKVTNKSGVTYHYALPAYSSKEYQYSQRKDESKGQYYNTYQRLEPYAYTWFLTAMTGPDYVDINNNGLDASDWGYWVEFDYGKWTDVYSWRNPPKDMMNDLDNEFENFSDGVKELYYLDAIRTASHTALFVKDIRNDARSRVYSIKKTLNGNPLMQDIDKEGSFRPQANLNTTCYWNNGDISKLAYNAYPTSSLKLSKIIILKNEDAQATDKSNGLEYERNDSYGWQTVRNVSDPNLGECPFILENINYHLYQNVFDVYDLATAGQVLMDNALKVIEFETDYSLMPNTPNSYATFCDAANPASTCFDDLRSGKLTLKKLHFKGRGGASVLPPTEFVYDRDKLFPEGSFINLVAGNTYRVNIVGDAEEFLSDVEIGNTLSFTQPNGRYYGYITKIVDDAVEFKPYGSEHNQALAKTNLKITTNPSYNSNAHDKWDYLKVDYDPDVIESNEILGRRVSDFSAGAMDAWSLRKIKTSLGAEVEIDYEADSYEESVLAPASPLRVKNVEKGTKANELKITFFNDGTDISNILTQGEEVNILLTSVYEYYKQNSGFYRIGCDCNLSDNYYQTVVEDHYKYSFQNISVNSTIQQISNDEIYIVNAEMYNKLTSNTFTQDWDTGFCADEYTCSYAAPNNWPNYIAGGLVSPLDESQKGGGLRLKSIAVNNGNHCQTTMYNYKNGSTSFEPYGILPLKFNPDFKNEIDQEGNEELNEIATNFLRLTHLNYYSEVLENARLVPSPSVLYGTVEVTEKTTHSDGNSYKVPGKATYEFRTFGKEMVGTVPSNKTQTVKSGTLGRSNYQVVESANIEIKDFTSAVGALKKISHYGSRDNQGQEEFFKTEESTYIDLYDLVDHSNVGVNDPEIEDGLEANIEQLEPLLATRFNNQGVIHEGFANQRVVQKRLPGVARDNNADVFFAKAKVGFVMGTLATLENYPTVNIGETHTNFKTGIQTNSYTVGYDFYSGEPDQTVNSDGYGNYYLNESVPAYRVPEYSSMGIALTEGNKNMLTQEAQSTTWKISSPTSLDNLQNYTFNKIGLVSSSVQTWGDDIASKHANAPDVWRKKSTYSWVGENQHVLNDGLYPVGQFIAFNRVNEQSNPPSWEKGSEITLYDKYTHPLEAKDVNGNLAATKFSNDNTLVHATAVNSGYDNFGYAGMEDSSPGTHLEGGISKGAGIITSDHAHTGDNSLLLDGQAFDYQFEPEDAYDRWYKVSFWVHESYSSNIQLAYAIATVGSIPYQYKQAELLETKKAGEWYLVNFEFQSSKDAIRIYTSLNTSGPVHIDDYRIHPIDATMTSYVYNEYDELTHVLNANNLYTEYKYDPIGRLIEITSERMELGPVKVSDIKYNYARSQN